MFPLPVWAKALQRSAAVQLARLRRTLDSLTERLREAIARAADDAVSGAVRAVIQKLLDRAHSSFAGPPRHKHTVLSSWDEDQNRAWHRAHDELCDDHSEERLDDQEAPSDEPVIVEG